MAICGAAGLRVELQWRAAYLVTTDSSILRAPGPLLRNMALVESTGPGVVYHELNTYNTICKLLAT